MQKCYEELKKTEMASDNEKTLSQNSQSDLSKVTHLQKINQRKIQLKNLSRSKKVEKLAYYLTCKVLYCF